MAFAADHAVLLDRLDDELLAAPEAARAVFAKIIGSACSRIPVLGKSGKAARIERLIEAGAWTDAAMAVIELEMPAWTLRRLVYENGEWFCSLSRQPNMPADLDDSADAAHQVLPLAILRSFLEARRRSEFATESASAVPQFRPAAHGIVCCDNFA
ncbi:MAG: hypothetical protein WB764_12900 [Xanthobacteraceae bacterium]